MARNEININIGNLYVSVVTEHDYPDVIDDMANKARQLVKDILKDMRENGVDIEDIIDEFSNAGFEEDDEGEEV